ncbi:Mak10 subunit, NatC N-terminal acetyltransferase-domain-containing protein [Neohortaea acidophila]|uniref:Mak10 subunit, NatC N-terminal acetyltransferase-domain-containing protein n=1 Tax=Neohortaea acidophila TaxID=245834 RepID=A0A6A6PFQ4_9PEZI|nr:Mak10 subunit, NatC N-terminal acetyltransferase-domain-containing protein [Neohortaea acidophila]KAF2478792.1 Mak10 subunit, NatC N-terminal acetyltransferase-domain-containing protein [Neohortaea acidophila]
MPVNEAGEGPSTTAASETDKHAGLGHANAITRLQQEAMAFRRRTLRNITTDFTVAAKQLQPGELVKDEFFTLFEAVGALEIMDPKMDSGYIPPGDTLDPDFDPSVGLEAGEVIWIMDQLLCLEITWLEGHPLSQTVYTSLHINRLLSPDQRHSDSFHINPGPPPLRTNQDTLVHTVLRAYCIGMIKSSQLALHLIQSQTYFEEEDFVTHLFGRELLPKIDSSAAADSLLEAICWLETCGIAGGLCPALLQRCKFCLDLLRTLAGDAQRWQDMLLDLDQIKDSHHLGSPIPDAFSEKVQRQLATSTPPRPTIQISLDAAHSKWTKLCQEMLSAYELTDSDAIDNSHCLERAVWAFAYRTQPETLARAQMQDLLFSNHAVRGQMPHYDLMLTDLKSLVLAGDPLSNPEIFQIELPTDPRHACSALLREFMEKAIEEFMALYRMVYQNRCRIRRLFTQSIGIWDELQREADAIDDGLRQYPLSSQVLNSGYARTNGPLLSWARYHTSQVLVWTVQLGFETEIYLPDELSKMYWYLSALCTYRNLVIESMLRALLERKRRVRGGSRDAADCVASQQLLMSLLDASKVTESLAAALWKFYYLLGQTGIIKSPKREFAKPDLLHEARMKSYLNVPAGFVTIDLPPADGYESAVEALEQHQTGSHSMKTTTFQAIDEDLKAAKSSLAALKKYTPEQGGYVGTEAEWKKEIKQIETTCVAVAVGLSTLKRLGEKYGDGQRLGLQGLVECALERKYHVWWVIPQLKEKAAK